MATLVLIFFIIVVILFFIIFAEAFISFTKKEINKIEKENHTYTDNEL